VTAGAGERRTERLPRALRVRRRPDYLNIQNRGRRLGGTHLLLFALPGTGRLGITVTKKIGGAVARNRVKRWVRDCFRRARDKFPPALDLVVVARAGAAEAGHQALCRELKALASRCAGVR